MTRLSIFASLCLLLSGCGLWVDNFVPEEPDFDAALPDVGGVDVGAPDAGFDASRWDGGSCSRNEDCVVLNTGCTEGVCVGSACVAEPKMDGTACVNGTACTDAGMCVSGVCVAPARDCTALDSVCAVGACDIGMDMCLPVPANTGGDCEDEDLCSWDDVCGGVSCQGVITDCGVRAEIPPRTITDIHGNSLTGETFDDPCPRGQVMIGARAGLTSGTFYDSILYRYASLCGVVQVSDAGVVSITPGDEVPAIGRGGYMPAPSVRDAVVCPANHVVVSVGVAISLRLDSVADARIYPSKLALRCAPLTASGSMDAGFTATVGPMDVDELTLGTRGDRYFNSTCPSGTVALGSVGRFGDVLDALGLRCGPVELAVITTAPQAGLTHSADTVFRDDCPWGTVPAGVVAGVTTEDVLTQFQTLCAPFRVSPSGGAWIASVGTPSASGPSWGSSLGIGPNRASRQCPPGQVLVGYEAVATSDAVTQLTLRCAEPMVSGPLAGEPSFSIGAVTAVPPLGTRVDGTRVGPYVCPSGMLGRGFFGSAVNVVNSVSLRCARPSFMMP